MSDSNDVKVRLRGDLGEGELSCGLSFGDTPPIRVGDALVNWFPRAATPPTPPAVDIEKIRRWAHAVVMDTAGEEGVDEDLAAGSAILDMCDRLEALEAEVGRQVVAKTITDDIAEWDSLFHESARFDNLGLDDHDFMRRLVETLSAPEGHEATVMYGLDGGTPWLCAPGIECFEDSWREVSCDGDLDGATISIRLGHAPVGWTATLGEFDGF